MTGATDQSMLARRVWALVAHQHGVIARWQLLALGFSTHAIAHRISIGRLHPLWPGVYAVGRPEVTREGRWMAAVLFCGPGAALSHRSAAALWGIAERERAAIDVSGPGARRRKPGLAAHRRPGLDVLYHRRIPATTPALTLVDLAAVLHRDQLERAVNEADKLDLIDPEALRAALVAHSGRPGVQTLRQLLDRHTFTLTDSRLEQRFLPIVRRVGLPLPLTQRRVNGFRVDFFWPGLGLVVETDGLRVHRTPGQQARDALRDQTHTAAGLTPLRFTHAQIRFEPQHVEAILTAVMPRLGLTHARERPHG